MLYLDPIAKCPVLFWHFGNSPPQHPLVQISPTLGTLNTITLQPSVQGRDPGQRELTTPELGVILPTSQAGFDPEN